MATASIPTMEPPLCPESDADVRISPSAYVSIPPGLCFVAVVVFAIATGLILWRWQTRSPRCSAEPTRASIQLEAKADFLARAGSSYGYANSKKGFIDGWRSIEFPTLIPPLKMQTDEQRDSKRREQTEPEVYLDYAGSAIPTRTLLSRICSADQILANPHSYGGGLGSDRTLKLMQVAKDRVMHYFGIQHETFGLEELDRDVANASEEDNVEEASSSAMPCPGYQLVFTSGATESLRLVAERFPWSTAKITADHMHHIKLRRIDAGSLRLKSMQAQSILLFPRNVHTSVIGMREAAMQRGALFRCVPVDQLLNARSDWFQSIVTESISHEDQRMNVHDAGHVHEEKKDDSIAAGDREAESTGCKTIWMHHLLVLPLECNFGGDRFDWSSTATAARKRCFSTHVSCYGEDEQRAVPIRICHKWHVLLDTAKAAATSPVNLPTLTNEGGPEFAVVSFYKMLGSPTGLGALFVKKNRRRTTRFRSAVGESPASRPKESMHSAKQCIPESLLGGGVLLERSIAQRQYFGGGSVDVVLPEKDFVVPRNGYLTQLSDSGIDGNTVGGEDEDIDLGVMVHGTEHFRGIASLSHGFQEIDDLGGMEAISSHSVCLAAELISRLRKLTHGNDTPAVELYGQWKSFATESILDVDLCCASERCPGPTVAFNIRDRDGSLIGYDEVARLASLNRPPIQLRTGCFCNPGACQDALPLSNEAVLENYASGHVCGDRKGIVNGKPTGAIRASFGKDSLWEDLDALVAFVEKVFVSRVAPQQTPFDRESQAAMIIDRLFVFPIKSCAAMRVRRWPIDRRAGRLAFDREFALVDTAGSAMRLHSHPKMSEIESSIDLNTQLLTVTAPHHEDLVINLAESSGRSVSPEDIQVCGILCKGNIWGGSKASRWFSSVLGVRCWLARHFDAGEATSLSDDGHRSAYCNEASLLLVSQQSISFLNSVISAQGWGREVESRHFRPNIVVVSKCHESKATETQDAEEHNPEDSWQQITISGSTDKVELRAVGKCARCQMVDIDPTSGMKGNTLRALAQYRRERGRINFGTFFTGLEDALEGAAWLEEGSEVQASTFTSDTEPIHEDA